LSVRDEIRTTVVAPPCTGDSQASSSTPQRLGERAAAPSRFSFAVALSSLCEPMPFHRREAAAAGISRRTLRGPEFERRRRAVYCATASNPCVPRFRIAEVCADLPDGAVVGGWAAAWLHLAAGPRPHRAARPDLASFFTGLAADGSLRPLLLCAPPETRIARRAGVQVFRSAVPDSERSEVAGFPLTTPTRTAFDLARLFSWEKAVVALDLLRSGLGLDLESLQALCGERRGWRGVNQVRRALQASEAGVESPQETRLRLAWAAIGLPRPACNVGVGTVAGVFVARVDLLDVRAGVVGEYDGVVHAASAARRADAVRQERLEDLGLVVVRATADDLRTRADRLAWCRRLVAAYRRAEQQPSSSRQWRLLTEPHEPRAALEP
jgi:hypothetical protein